MDRLVELLLKVLMVFTIVTLPGLNVSASDLQRDERLDQKVSYTRGYTRLHTVVEELGKATKVNIRCGSSKDDWRVRDVPVIVFVKDMPMGKLLHALADATHSQLFRKNSSSESPSYSIYRTKAMEREFTGPLDAKVKANIILADWAWDTLTAFADLPDTPKPSEQDKNVNNSAYINARQSKLISKALKFLGPKAKDKVLSGEKLVVQSDTPACRSVIMDLLTAVASANRSFAGDSRVFPGKILPPTDAELQSAHIEIAQNPNSGSVLMYLSDVPVLFDGSDHRITITWWGDSATLADFATSSGQPGLPTKPDTSLNAKPQERYPKGMLVLEKDEDWTRSTLQKKIELKLPEKGHLSREDLLRSLHESSGTNIVCEDFACHRWGPDAWVKADFGANPTIASVAKAVNVPDQGDGPWFFGENDKLLVNWAGKWREHHIALVPESLFSGLRKKIRGKGADLDDLTPLLWLSREQKREWIDRVEDFASVHLPDWTCLWKLYDKLSPEERYQAKSTVGLKLSGLDPAWLWDLISTSLKYDSGGRRTNLTLWHAPNDTVELSGPSDFSDLAIRMVKEPLQVWMSACMVDGQLLQVSEVKGDFENVRYSCVLEILRIKDNKILYRTAWDKTPFPVQFTKRKRASDGRSWILLEWGNGE